MSVLRIRGKNLRIEGWLGYYICYDIGVIMSAWRMVFKLVEWVYVRKYVVVCMYIYMDNVCIDV